MGLFDGIANALNNALSNDESLGAPPPDGLSQVKDVAIPGHFRGPGLSPVKECEKPEAHAEPHSTKTLLSSM